MNDLVKHTFNIKEV